MQTWTNCLIKTCLPLASELPALSRRAGFNVFYVKSQELVLASCSTTVHSIEQIPRASSFPSLPIPPTQAEMLLAACPPPRGPETVVLTQQTKQKCCFQYIFNKPAHGAACGGGQSSVCAAGLAQKASCSLSATPAHHLFTRRVFGAGKPNLEEFHQEGALWWCVLEPGCSQG